MIFIHALIIVFAGWLFRQVDRLAGRVLGVYR